MKHNSSSTSQVSVASHILTFDHDSETDFNCPEPISDHKGIKFNLSDIMKLWYDSNVVQFSNWLEDLKAAFYDDFAKYSMSHHKIIFVIMIIDKQLKTIFNSVMLDHSAISSHWQKFKHWIKDIVLYRDSNCLKLLNKFTMICQHLNENSNQFHLCLFNLEIQSECTVSIKDYRMYLIEFLQNIIIQQDHTYFTVQDLVVHADKLWQTLDLNKVH